MASDEGDGVRPVKGRIVAALALLIAAGCAFALPRALVRSQSATQAERPPTASSLGPPPVTVVKVAPSLVTAAFPASPLSPAQHARVRPVLTIPRPGALVPVVRIVTRPTASHASRAGAPTSAQGPGTV